MCKVKVDKSTKPDCPLALLSPHDVGDTTLKILPYQGWQSSKYGIKRKGRGMESQRLNSAYDLVCQVFPQSHFLCLSLPNLQSGADEVAPHQEAERQPQVFKSKALLKCNQAQFSSSGD